MFIRIPFLHYEIYVFTLEKIFLAIPAELGR